MGARGREGEIVDATADAQPLPRYFSDRSALRRSFNASLRRYASRRCAQCAIEMLVQGIANGVKVVTRISL
jgi:hypothetical protein